MDTIVIRAELHGYIDSVSDEKLEEIYALMKNEKHTPYEWWKDEELVAELERRSADLKSGKDPGVTLEESMARLKSRRKKNG
jgi:putative addiction module component (TIGR02574 family)